MRKTVDTLVITCDACKRNIPLNSNIHQPLRTYFSFKEIDLCSTCSINVLESLMSVKILREDSLKEVIDDYSLSFKCPKGNIAYC